MVRPPAHPPFSVAAHSRPGSRVSGRAFVPDEPYAPRGRSVHFARGLLRSHDDGRAYCRTALEHRQRPARARDGKPHTWPQLVRPGIRYTATVLLAALGTQPLRIEGVKHGDATVSIVPTKAAPLSLRTDSSNFTGSFIQHQYITAHTLIALFLYSFSISPAMANSRAWFHKFII
jgi:hypothetical protein